jgi:hypothetical protein
MEFLSAYGPEVVAGLFVLLSSSIIGLMWFLAAYLERQAERAIKEERARYRKAEGIEIPDDGGRHHATPKEESSASKLIRALRNEQAATKPIKVAALMAQAAPEEDAPDPRVAEALKRESSRYSASSIMERLEGERELRSVRA